MKLSNFLPVILVAVAVATSGMGCKKTPKNVTNIPGSSSPTSGGPNNMSGPLPGSTRPINPGNPAANDSGTRTSALPPGSQDSGNNLDKLGTGLNARPEDMNEDRLTLSSQSVYFDYDKSTVRSSEHAKVESVAAFLKNQPKAILRIEGSCDERGTEEYNRALGERRALAVREYLLTLGVTADRVTTLSFGEDKPANPGHDEAAWSQNRRGEFVVLRAKQ